MNLFLGAALSAPFLFNSKIIIIMGSLAFIIPAAIALIGSLVSYVASDNTTEASIQEAYKAREFSQQERVEQNEYEQQMLEFNALNLPSIQRLGFEKAGMSTAGALQAIAGGSGQAITPTASNGPGIQPSLPQPNTSFQGFDSLNNIFDNFLKQSQQNKIDSDIDKNKADIKLTNQFISESNARMDKMAHDMDIDNENLDLAKRITNSQLGLNYSQVKLNLKKIDEVDQHIKVMMAQVENLDAQTIAAYAQASLYRSQATYYDAAAEVQSATVGLVNAQIQGQNIANLDSSIVAALKQYRLQVSEALGCDVDAPLVTQIVEAMIAGRFDTVNMLFRAYESTNDGSNPLNRLYGTFYRSAEMDNWKYHDSNGKPIYNFDHGVSGFSPSFQPLWSPQ